MSNYFYISYHVADDSYARQMRKAMLLYMWVGFFLIDLVVGIKNSCHSVRPCEAIMGSYMLMTVRVGSSIFCRMKRPSRIKEKKTIDCDQ